MAAGATEQPGHGSVGPPSASRAGGGSGGADAGSRRAWGWPLLVSALTFSYAFVPPLVGSGDFYRRGDSASQFLPTWYHLGELLRSGYWPPLLDPNSWQGGNYPAEALFGVYNPLNALNWLLVSATSNLDVAAVFVKAEFLTILALGVYLLCREYDAVAWASSIVAVAMPFAGFTLYWEAASWASGLSAFMYMPHVWWSFRRAGRGRLNPLWAFLIGALAVTQGNPYGVLGVVVVGIGLVVECLVQRCWAALRRVLITGACVATLLPLVLLPLIATAPLAHRSNLAGITNNGMMRPNLGDLLNLSAPSYLPQISTFADPMRVPTVYLFWLLLPLLPWLRWSIVRSRVSNYAAVFTVAGLYVLMTLAPSRLWLFRWPLRLVEYFQLCLAVLLAVLLSTGIARDRARLRFGITWALVAFGAYLSVAQTPQDVVQDLAVTLLVAILVGAFLWAARSQTGWLTMVAVAQTGTLLVLVSQVWMFPQNASAGDWNLPASIDRLHARLTSLYTGTTVVIAKLEGVRDETSVRGSRAWGDLAAGNVYHAAGVATINSYTGVGLDAFTSRLCMDFAGATRRCGYTHLFGLNGRVKHPLSELLKVQTVVVQRGLLPRLVVPRGWQMARGTKQVIVLHPKEQWRYPSSRLSLVPKGVRVQSARTLSATEETLHVSSNARSPRRLIFARLGWPGYSATLNGTPLQVSRTRSGLLTVILPAGQTSGLVDVTFTPPGQHLGLGLAGLGLLVATSRGVRSFLRRPRVATWLNPNGRAWSSGLGSPRRGSGDPKNPQVGFAHAAAPTAYLVVDSSGGDPGRRRGNPELDRRRDPPAGVVRRLPRGHRSLPRQLPLALASAVLAHR